jgi:steroid delta-isomerase-like uncharacterized protein
MSTSKNKAVIRRHVEEVFNKGNLSIADEIISPDYIYHGPLGEFKGVEGFKQMVAMARKALPDIHYTIDEMVAEDETVTVRYTMTGTFKGELMGIPPTGKSITQTQAFFYHFKNGKELEALPFSDMLSFYQQLGIPIPPG